MTTLSGTSTRHYERSEPLLWPGCGDMTVLLLVGVLMTIGCVMVYSASVSVEGAELALRQWWRTPLRQCVFALAGFVAMIAAAHVDLRWVAWDHPRKAPRQYFLFGLAAALLIGMHLFGHTALGAQRSIIVFRSPFVLSFQPAEAAKILLVLWLAGWLTRPGGQIQRLKTGYLPAVVSAGLICGLVGIEDFGTAALLAAVTGALLLLGHARWRHLVATALLGLAGAAVLVLSRDYRRERILNFFTEAPDTQGGSYQITQALLAIGSGGWWGRGLGAGIRKYGYLPQDNNDFIFAILCEELGVIGGLVVIALFIALTIVGWRIYARAQDPFVKLVAVGMTLLIALQAAFNILVVTDSVPTKGISLPFVSAGGSGVVFLGIAAGLLAAAGRRERAA